MKEVTLVAASYHWQCPECGQEHYERFVAERVVCPVCGSIFDVNSVEHRFRQEPPGGAADVRQGKLF